MFIFKKQCQLDQEKKRETVVDAIFKKSLREFHMELLGCEAVSVRLTCVYFPRTRFHCRKTVLR